MPTIEEIDSNKNGSIDLEEIKKALSPNGFLNEEENVKNLGEQLNTDYEGNGIILNSLKESFQIFKNEILNKQELSEEDAKVLNVYETLFLPSNCTDEINQIKELINIHQNSSAETKDNEQEVNALLQEIENETNFMLSNPVENIRNLGIEKQKKGTELIRKNIVTDIKTLDDITKINEKNLSKYLKIPQNIPSNNYQYIAENIQSILYNHLSLNPGWQCPLGKGGYCTGISIDSIQDYDLKLQQLYKKLQEIKKKPEDIQINTLINNLPNCDLLDLRLKTTLTKDNQERLICKLFDKIALTNSDKFFQACNKNQFINELKSNYIKYQVNKNNRLKTDNQSYQLLDWSNQSKLKNLYNKGDEGFDELYDRTKGFYNNLQKFGIDKTIPLNAIVRFLNYKSNKDKENIKIESQKKDAIKKSNDEYYGSSTQMTMSMMGRPGQGNLVHNAGNKAIASSFDEKIYKNCINIEEEYAKLLLQKNPKPTGRIPGISGTGVDLDFSKGSDPKQIVRDSFGEKFGDQREKFEYNLKNDRQAAFGSALGMISGIAGSALVAIYTQNIRATSAGFTAGLRLGNGIGQELWNSGERLYEKASGQKISDGNNKVTAFGTSFLRGAGVYDENYEYVGTAKLLSGLGFDYLSNAATFGLGKQFEGFLGALEGIRFAGGALKFGMEELVLENFLVDIPMNIVQTGFETFTGIDNGLSIGNTAIGNQKTIEGQGYKSGSLLDALRAMKEAGEQNLSFENLSQTFFNTVVYGGLLEGGGAAIRKIKGYLPSGQVANFESRSTIAATAIAGLTSFMSKSNIEVNEIGKFIDSKTKIEISETDARFTELCTHLTEIKATESGVIESLETMINTQKNMIADSNNMNGLLFRLGLISDKDTPLNILKKKIGIIENKVEEAKIKGDTKKIEQLKNILDTYTDAANKLDTYFNGKSHKFNVTESQARSNSSLMDIILTDINEQNKSEKFNKLRDEINAQYKQATGKELNLTDEQLSSLLKAHSKKGALGEIESDELRIKVEYLAQTITDKDIRRFLLEAGFCGSGRTTFLGESITAEQKSEIGKRLLDNNDRITDTEKALDFWSKAEDNKYIDSKIDITGIKEKIDNARKALNEWIEGTGKQYKSIEKFLEEHQLGLNEGMTGDTKRKKMDNNTKMLLTRLYYESILKPLGITNFANPSLTMTHVNLQFLDTEHSVNFHLDSEWDSGTTSHDTQTVGNNILKDIGIIEGRIDSGDTTIKELDINKYIQSIGNQTEKEIAQELRQSIQKHGEGKISQEDQAYLFATSMMQMADYRTAYPKATPQQVFNLLNSNQNKIIHQHLWDLKTITSSDHGIKHILRGNATLAENFFHDIDSCDTRDKIRENLYEKNRDADESIEEFKARFKSIVRQAIIDHDLGYTNIINKSFDEAGFGKSFHMVSDHPLWSTIWVENNQSFYTEIYGEKGYNAIRESLPGHGNAQTGNIDMIFNGDGNLTSCVRGILSCVDCAGSPGDYKIAHMFAQKTMIGGLYKAYKLLQQGDVSGTKQTFENMIKAIDRIPNTGYLSQIKESRKEGIQSFLENKNFEIKNTKELSNAFSFQFKKFLGAFGVETAIDSETGRPKSGLNFTVDTDNNIHAGWNIEYNLAGDSFELLAKEFGSKLALKSFIGVCDDYGISDGSKCIQDLTTDIQKAVNESKETGGNLTENIKKVFNESFNGAGIKTFNDGIQIEFTGTGIIIYGPNNISINLNFEGKNYKGFSETVSKINKLSQKLNILKEKLKLTDNPQPIINQVKADLANILIEIEQTERLDKGDREKIADKLTDNISTDEAISIIENLESTYGFIINDISASNPANNN